MIPNLDVIRPADPEETAGAFAAARARTEGPTLLALTRQVVPKLNDIVQARREGVRGRLHRAAGNRALDTIILSCGSELQHAIAAAKELGDGVRVVSMPSFERFDHQPQSTRTKSCQRVPQARRDRSRRALTSGGNTSDSTAKSSASIASA